LLDNKFSRKKMILPKFLLADNTDFPDDVFVIHLEYPRFIINLKDDEIEFIEEIEATEEEEILGQMQKLIEEANLFYDRETERYQE